MLAGTFVDQMETDMKTTWRDWLASRTIKFNAFMAAAWAALLPVFLTMTAADWQAIGFSERTALLAVMAVQIAGNAWNAYLRADTHRPLAGRSAYGKGD